MGFALVFGGGAAVDWYTRKDTFPYVSGFVPVVISWFSSPILACIVTFIMYLIVRFLVLRRKNSTKIAYLVRGPGVLQTKHRP